ncbi:hypothetical protein QN412_19320 [Pseudomonas sp. RTB3]|uniref:hypothetical protein n=1 Tax=unclassified Pseudomonas TaxID=196821 RepID=UPI002B22204E|nr:MULTISPECIES: hypothetical protein [unclassified Pseudomonas]MEB0005155.1 hypothetical protein [Pseudomonas sp. RTB2]MEB0019080.1 hypothetical protein [Pseudomonas sp. RTB3]MEB0271138.1 hypothetical protein [Pseudomonas sp. 5B4]
MQGNLFRTLQQEAHVIRSCLTIGLTELRNADLNEKGRYYTAFFQLAIGIERLAKLALILDHMAQNNLKAPGQKVVKDYGHDLLTLVSKVEDVVRARGYTVSSDFPNDSFCLRALAFLSDFAKGMRYANLDALASGNQQRDPLSEWNKILQDVAVTKVGAAAKHKIDTMAAAASHVLSDRVAVFASDLTGKPLTLSSAFSEPSILDAASKYMVWEIITLLAPLRDAVVEAGDAADALASSVDPNGDRVPVLSEFFDFIWLDRTYVFRKKRWP